MNILFVAATFLESEKIISNLNLKKVNDYFYSQRNYNIDLIITGIGVPAVMFSLFTEVNIRKYDFIINFGIAGSFSQEIKVGDVVNVVSDKFADITISSNSDDDINVFDTEFNQKFNNYINNSKILNTSDYHHYFNNIKKVKAVTVNSPEKKIYYDAVIETMEGAAVMLISKHFKKCFIQIRGISNVIGITKKNEWDFKTPVENYSQIIVKFILKYCKHEN